ncbi:DNA-processing protein DprA [Microbacterium sp. A1-JK]|uniref:DNA-processing protein DprA n=1 Tax=Microbacterium sp. A1-JK TaxID=3177516 RepID=UPI0038872FB9
MRIEVTAASARATLSGVREVDDDDATLMDAFARLIWGVVVEPGDGVAGRVVEQWGAAEALRRLVAGQSLTTDGIDASDLAKGLARWKTRGDATAVRAAVESARRTGARLILPGDPGWPGRLADLGVHGPFVLWSRGDTALVADDRRTVAIVGARAATAYGEHVAGELAAELASAGITIVSGAAYGIDGVAHRSALHVGGRTVALLAGGVDRPYPSGHAALIDATARSGAVLAETPCGTPPTKWRFLARNRLIAALADATVVVEAGVRSGSLNTAAHEAALGRPLGAVPGAITSASSAGCHRVIRDFDGALVTCAGDVREMLGLSDAPTLSFDETRTDEMTRVLDAMSTRQSRSADEIARRSGIAPQEAEGLIALAELSGQALERADGWRRAPSTR